MFPYKLYLHCMLSFSRLQLFHSGRFRTLQDERPALLPLRAELEQDLRRQPGVRLRRGNEQQLVAQRRQVSLIFYQTNHYENFKLFLKAYKSTWTRF